MSDRRSRSARPHMRRLITIPGVDVVTAATMLAVIGDIARFPSRATSSATSGSTHASASRARPPPRTGESPSKARARRATCSSKPPGRRNRHPVRCTRSASESRLGAARRWRAVAVARKLCVLCWQLLTRNQDYAYARPALVQRKLRRLELRAGAPSQRGKRGADGKRGAQTPSREDREKALALQAELSYRRLVADWQASRPNSGTGAAPRRAPAGRHHDRKPGHGPRYSSARPAPIQNLARR